MAARYLLAREEEEGSEEEPANDGHAEAEVAAVAEEEGV